MIRNGSISVSGGDDNNELQEGRHPWIFLSFFRSLQDESLRRVREKHSFHHSLLSPSNSKKEALNRV